MRLPVTTSSNAGEAPYLDNRDERKLQCRPINLPELVRTSIGQLWSYSRSTSRSRGLSRSRSFAARRCWPYPGTCVEVTERNPDRCSLEHRARGHESTHQHGPGCGHEAVPHGNHIDYLVDGRLHHPHGDHCDDHGPLSVVSH